MNRIKPCTLSNIYQRIPRFGDFIEQVYSAKLISSAWKKTLTALPQTSTVLEIGAGYGRVTGLLVKHGSIVTAVEPDIKFYNSLNKTFVRNKRVVVLKVSFPRLPRRRYDYIVLHQNVFLELINQRSLAVVIRDFKKFLKPGGQVLFDYVWPFMPIKGSKAIIYQGAVKGLGKVSYTYKYLGGTKSHNHSALIEFSRATTVRRELYRGKLSFYLPPWAEIDRVVKQQGGRVVKHPMSGFSFFPGKLLLARMRF